MEFVELDGRTIRITRDIEILISKITTLKWIKSILSKKQASSNQKPTFSERTLKNTFSKQIMKQFLKAFLLTMSL